MPMQNFGGQIGCIMGDMQVEFTYQLHLRLTSVFWSITFKTAALQNVTNNTWRKKNIEVWLYNKFHNINISGPLGAFLFYVILTISYIYLRAWTI